MAEDKDLIAGRGDGIEPGFDSPVRGSPLGDFLPETAYRPVPIAWFAAAWFVHSLALAVLFMVFSGKPAFVILASTGLVSLMVLRWTFGRGMAQARLAWRVATVGALALNWLWVGLLTLAR